MLAKLQQHLLAVMYTTASCKDKHDYGKQAFVQPEVCLFLLMCNAQSISNAECSVHNDTADNVAI